MDREKFSDGHNPYAGRSPEDTVQTNEGPALIGTTAAENAIGDIINTHVAKAPELSPEEQEARGARLRALLNNENTSANPAHEIPRATLPAEKRLGSLDVGSTPTTEPGERVIRTEEGNSFKRPKL